MAHTDPWWVTQTIMQQRMTSPCRACGVSLTYPAGEVRTTDLLLDLMRQTLSRLSELEAKLDAKAPHPCGVCNCRSPECSVCSPRNREGGGVEL